MSLTLQQGLCSSLNPKPGEPSTNESGKQLRRQAYTSTQRRPGDACSRFTRLLIIFISAGIPHCHRDCSIA
jgi:hypothetical protein